MADKPALPPPRYDRRESCAQCPYRTDAPLAKWHPDHFVKLLRDDADLFTAPVYGCHNRDGNVCVGWLLDQRDRDLPNIRLRLSLARSPEFITQLREAHDGDHPRFESVRAMCLANLSAMIVDRDDE